MLNDKNLTSSIIKRTLVYSLIIIGIMLLGIKNPKPYILGFIFGMSISVLAFKLLDNTIQKSVTMKPPKAYGYSVAHYLIRYIIYIVVLTVAAIADYLNFPATVLGLLMIKIVIMTSTIYDSIKFRKK